MRTWKKFILSVLIIAGPFLLAAAATQINLATQVKGLLAIANGGTGTGATLTGLVRGNAAAMTASELSGDCTTSGSNAITCTKVNSTTIPVNASPDQTLVTSASATGSWASIPNCTSGALQYATATHTFSCGAFLSGTFADAEVPVGTINGVNATFTLAHTVSPAASLKLFLNGQELIAGGTDYTLATATITMVAAPKTGDVL